MVTILDELIEKLKNHTFTIDIKDIRDPYSTKNPIYPMVTIEEITNRPFVQILDKELFSSIAYRFEVYARDTSQDSKVYTKREVVNNIGNEIDDLIKKNYGFRRIGDPQILPYGGDNTIIRYIVTYGGKIDTTTMITYQ